MNRKRRRTAAKAGRSPAPAPARASAVEAGDTLKKAQALHESGQFEDAAALYGRILGRDPRRSDVFHRIGVDAVDKGDWGAGAALIRKAIEANPAVASYHVDLAHALEHQGRLEETVEAYRRALEIDPGDARAHKALGHVLNVLDRPAEAEAAFRRALGPDDMEAYNYLAVVLKAQGRLDEAIEACRKAIGIKPDYAEGHVHLADCLLLDGQFEEGLREYEWRGRLGDVTLPGRRLAQPQWDGADPAGKTILVVGEQGFGDTIQFCRYAPLIRARGARVVLAVQPALKDLCSRMDGVDRVVTSHQPLPEFDLHVPLLSLPFLFGTTLETVPAQVPYLRPAPEHIAHWRETLADKPGLRVGIAWQGTPVGGADRGRSLDLERFLPIARMPGVRLFSLQKGHGHEQLGDLPEGVGIADLGSRCATFDDTAGVMANLDLVITSDTSVAHLAGALGRPVWVALKRSPDWRWLLERADSPWYPTMRLFRQRVSGEWDDVFEAISAAVAERLGERSGAP